MQPRSAGFLEALYGLRSRHRLQLPVCRGPGHEHDQHKGGYGDDIAAVKEGVGYAQEPGPHASVENEEEAEERVHRPWAAGAMPLSFRQ